MWPLTSFLLRQRAINKFREDAYSLFFLGQQLISRIKIFTKRGSNAVLLAAGHFTVREIKRKIKRTEQNAETSMGSRERTIVPVATSETIEVRRVREKTPPLPSLRVITSTTTITRGDAHTRAHQRCGNGEPYCTENRDLRVHMWMRVVLLWPCVCVREQYAFFPVKNKQQREVEWKRTVFESDSARTRRKWERRENTQIALSHTHTHTWKIGKARFFGSPVLQRGMWMGKKHDCITERAPHFIDQSAGWVGT